MSIPNRVKYNFDDFTHKHYNDILQIISTKYKPCFFSEASLDSNNLLLRHDVDFSLERALDLAKIESEFGIKSTFFLLLHGEYYSIFEKKSFKIIHEIIHLGHKIGLHFDSHFYDINIENNLDSHLLFEKKILENLFSTEVDVFSFHNTTDFTMSCKRDKYGNMINTYSSFYKDNFSYCSDSNGFWRFKRLEDFLKEKETKPKHILLHPEWWTDVEMSPNQKIQKIIYDRAKDSIETYESLLKSYGRDNIKW